MQQASSARRRVDRKRMIKAKRYRLVFIIAACAFVVMLLLYLGTLLLQYMDVKEQENLRDLYKGSVFNPSFALLDSAKAEEMPAEDVPERFEELWKINQDLIGWIKAGDAVDGPVVYHGDNDYYMDHSFYQQGNTSGTIFADEKNANWETDPYVILYGHNMRNGTMFGKMNLYRQLDYLKENPIVEFDTIHSESANAYVPFAIFDASVDADNDNFFYLRRFEDFENGDLENIQALISEVTERSMFAIPVEVTTEDRILVLVTCSYSDSNGRLMMFCRELREGETSDGIAEQMAQASAK